MYAISLGMFSATTTLKQSKTDSTTLTCMGQAKKVGSSIHTLRGSLPHAAVAGASDTSLN